jgi:hypothetical protein
MRWGRVLVGALLGAFSLGFPVHAQQAPEPPVPGGAVVVAPLGIPVGAQIIDVRWSGDRMGEFTILTTLPPAFRRAEGHSGPSTSGVAPFRASPIPTPRVPLR